MMENLDPEQADQLARFATESGVNDPRLSMRERAQAAETFGASLSAIMKSLQDDEITFKQGPGGLTVVMQDGKALDVVKPDSMAAFYNQFAGNETPEQLAERERLMAERAALQANR